MQNTELLLFLFHDKRKLDIVECRNTQVMRSLAAPKSFGSQFHQEIAACSDEYESPISSWGDNDRWAHHHVKTLQAYKLNRVHSNRKNVRHNAGNELLKLANKVKCMTIVVA
jgi:hypothetical protein